MCTPNYVTQTEKEFYLASGSGSVVLPANSFVRPVDIYYMPKHVKDANPWYNKSTHVICYCNAGLIIVPLDEIRRV